MKEKSLRLQEKESIRVLITGANGAVGTVLTEGLKDKFKIVPLDIAPNRETEFIVDVSDIQMLDAAIQKIGKIDSIIHLAANANDKTTWGDVLRNNIIGTRNTYECARKYGVRRIVFASSTHLFGKYPQYPDKLSKNPISIDAPHRPDGFYGISKGFGEDIARYYYDAFGIQTIIIRIGSLQKDNIPVRPYHLLWLSHRDAVQIFEKAVATPIEFGAYYAISVESTVFDIEPTKRDLGFTPQDTQLPEKIK